MKKKKKIVPPPFPASPNDHMERALFHSEIYLNEVDSVVDSLGPDGARENLKDILSKFGESSLKCAAFQKHDYFKKLHELYSKSEWSHLSVPDRVVFFKRWFVAISDDYIKAFTMLKHLAPELTGWVYLLDTIKADRKKFEEYFKRPFNGIMTKMRQDCNNKTWNDFSIESRFFYVLSKQVFGLHVDEIGRDMDLNNAFRTFTKDFQFSVPSAPAFVLDEPVSKEELLRLRGQVGVVPVFINVKYPFNEVLAKVREIFKHEQNSYFERNPDRALYIKEDITGRKVTNRFVEWERYLKIYMLKAQGTKTADLMKRFYDEHRGDDPERQLRRDIEKAARLSANAIAGNFPGQYSK